MQIKRLIMQRLICFMILNVCVILFAADPVFHDALPFLEGRHIEDAPVYGRLPREMETKVRPPVWRLGLNSAGLAAHFMTDATEIHVRWEVLNDFHMVHMAGTGIRGVDLYVREGNTWSFVGTGKPYAARNTAKLIANLSKETREYLLYCPLYDGLKELAIGIDEGADIVAVERNEKPLVFYGTSITQGGCVSRPGMAYPAIIGRELDRESINLGFSGNGRMDPEIIEFIAGIDAACVVFDCLPNMDIEMILERAEHAIRSFLETSPGTPLLLVPNFMPENGRHDPALNSAILAENAELETIYKRLKKQYRHLHLLPYRTLRDVPREGTVDGVHLTDLGQLRMAKVLEKKIKRICR